MSKGSTRPLPYGRQSIDASDIDAVGKVLAGDWLTTGPAVEAFESAFAVRVGAAHAVACSSGTAALHLALEALWLAERDHVIVPAISFLATANAVRFMGADVIFADVDQETGLLTADHAEAALKGAAGAQVKALLPVHLAGQCVDMAELKSFADAMGLNIVEDACHALGSIDTSGDDPAPVGACRQSDMATFSFHPVKTITTGEGGMVTCASADSAQRLRSMRNHGLSRDARAFQNAALAFDGETANPWYYEMEEVGFNYRLSDIQCALGLSQLARLDDFIAKRGELVARYESELADLAPVVRSIARAPHCEPAWHLFVVLIDFDQIGASRADVMGALNAEGIGSQVHYIPLYQQPYYRQRYGRQKLPGAEAYYARCLSLPLFPDMTQGDVDRVCGALKGIVAGG
jgi:UDP-4-amino-4,6-dideoxy-N-acetyl-beta-L-altrosamine transaminase